jgi:hypothetical protein
MKFHADPPYKQGNKQQPASIFLATDNLVMQVMSCIHSEEYIESDMFPADVSSTYQL